ncbi:hypothetical protein ACI2KR_08295 [Pseudomonas luteola]
MYQKLAKDLKLLFEQDLNGTLAFCPDPMRLYSDMVEQFSVGTQILSAYRDEMCEESIQDILAEARMQIINKFPSNQPPSAFLNALDSCVEEQEKYINYGVFKAIQNSLADLKSMKTKFTTLEMQQGVEHVSTMVKNIKSSNLHAELNNMAYFLSTIERQGMRFSNSVDAGEFMFGAGAALGHIQKQWSAFEPIRYTLNQKHSMSVNHWKRLQLANSMLNRFSLLVSHYQNSYMLFSHSISQEKLAREINLFRQAKISAVRLISDKPAQAVDALVKEHNMVSMQINAVGKAQNSSSQDRLYFMNVIGPKLIDELNKLRSEIEYFMKPELSHFMVKSEIISMPQNLMFSC